MAINASKMDNYDDTVKNFIIGSEGLETQVSDDGRGIPTLGYGYALVVEDRGSWENKATLEEDLESIGVSLSTENISVLTSIVRSLNENDTESASDLIENYDFGIEIDEDDGEALYEREKDRAEEALEGEIARHVGSDRAEEIVNNLSESREMVALVSLAYNFPELIGPGLAGALNEGNRAQAWLEIRYRSHENSTAEDPSDRPIDAAGIAKRRFFESELFGLFNDNSSSGEGVPEEEALQAYRVFTQNRDKILEYESLYGVNPDGSAGERDMISEANNDFNIAGVEVQTLEASFAPATEVLLEEYATSLDESLADTISFHNILVDRLDNDGSTETGTGTIEPFVGSEENDLLLGSDSGATLEGGKGNDVLWGGEKNDGLTGGEGNDYLVGGQGIDVFKGGAGSDVYVYNDGDGKDTIEDSDGQGVVRVVNDDLRLGIERQSVTHRSFWIGQSQTQSYVCRPSYLLPV